MSEPDAGHFLNNIAAELEGTRASPDEMMLAGSRHPCPVCGSSDGVAVDVGTKGQVLVHCHSTKMARHDEQIIEWLKERGVWPSRERMKDVDPEAWKAAIEKQRENRLKQAKLIYRAARDSGETPSAYLKARGIKTTPKNAHLIAQGAAIPRVDKFTGRRRTLRTKFPAAVFPVFNETHGFVGVHLIALNDRCNRKRWRKGAKRSYGLTKGGYVQLRKFDPELPLIVAEGPETALSAAQICDVPAIATLGTENMEALAILPKPYGKGSEVIIARDLGKGGRNAARILAARLARQGHKVRIAVPLKRKDDDGSWWDWNDCLSFANGDASHLKELERRLLKAPLVKAPKGHALTMSELLDSDIPEDVPRLLKPILVSRGLSMLHSPPGQAKTRLALSIGYACATGEDLMDWRVDEPTKVLYVDAELDPGLIKSWVGRLGPRNDNFIVLNDRWNYRQGRPALSLATEEDREYLRDQIGIYDPTLIVMDSLFTLAPPRMLEGRASEDLLPDIMDFLVKLTLERRSVLLLHHDKKSGGQYGSMLKTIRLDCQMQLRRRDEYKTDDRWAFELAFEKPRHLTTEEAEPRIITINTEGIVEWERADLPTDPREAKNRQNEVRVLELINEGKGTKEIAEVIGLSTRQVRNIKSRLGERNDDGEII